MYSVGMCGTICCQTSSPRFSSLVTSWSWKKTAVIAVALAAITVGSLCAVGVNSIATLCSFGVPVLILPFLIHSCISPYKPVIVIEQVEGQAFCSPIAQSTMPALGVNGSGNVAAVESPPDGPRVLLPLREGEPYRLQDYKDLIIQAIRTNTLLHWSGLSSSKNWYTKYAILPNLSIGVYAEENQPVIQFSPYSVDKPTIDSRIRREWEENTPIKTYYFHNFDDASIQETREQLDLMLTFVFRELEAGHSISFTNAPWGPDFALSDDTVKKADCGVMLLRFLIHLTKTKQDGTPSGVTVEEVVRYVETRLSCEFAEKLYYSNRQLPLELMRFLRDSDAVQRN